MFASPAYADWVEVAESESGDTYYVDFDRIRTNGGYVYHWYLVNFSEPSFGDLSYNGYGQVDCEVFRRKNLSTTFYKQPMGEGSGEAFATLDTEWKYPTPNSPAEIILKQVCEYAENL